MTIPDPAVDALRKAIADTLATSVDIPSGHRAALVTYVDLNKARLAFATRLNDTWSVELLGEHGWTGGNQVGLIAKATW